MSLFVFAIVLLLASCSKEPMLQTEKASVIPIETIDKKYFQSKNKSNTTINSADGSSVAVSKVTSSIVGGNLIVDFSSSHNFTDEDLVGTQTLDFVNASGKVSTLTFQVNSYTGSNGAVQVNYAIGGNGIDGLTIVVAQEIIIDEEQVN